MWYYEISCINLAYPTKNSFLGNQSQSSLSLMDRPKFWTQAQFCVFPGLAGLSSVVYSSPPLDNSNFSSFQSPARNSTSRQPKRNN